MRYFVVKGASHWSSKNNLQKDWKAFCQSKHRTILENKAEKKRFIADAEAHLQQLQAKHKRCKPLPFTNWKPGFEGHCTQIGVTYVSTLLIYEEREVQS